MRSYASRYTISHQSDYVDLRQTHYTKEMYTRA
jgi:hypothetical protein